MKRAYHRTRLSPRLQAAITNRAALAEHVSNEGSLASFARAHDLTERGVQKMWADIRAGLGAQAV
jgi:hypothetical protein